MSGGPALTLSTLIHLKQTTRPGDGPGSLSLSLSLDKPGNSLHHSLTVSDFVILFLFLWSSHTVSFLLSHGCMLIHLIRFFHSLSLSLSLSLSTSPFSFSLSLSSFRRLRIKYANPNALEFFELSLK